MPDSDYLKFREVVLRLIEERNKNHQLPEDKLKNTLLEIVEEESYRLTPHYKKMLVTDIKEGPASALSAERFHGKHYISGVKAGGREPERKPGR